MNKEIIYQVMNGDVDLEYSDLPENITVVDEFDSKRECGRLYEKVYAAKARLEERLGVQEDADVEEIIDCMASISKILAMKMYDYGMEER